MLPRVTLMHVLGPGTRRYDRDDKRIGAPFAILQTNETTRCQCLFSAVQ